MSTYGTTEYNERFGARLRNLMYEREKTAAMMAKDLKISKASISNWTTGKRLPRAGAMSAICHYLNCTRADLLEDVPQAVQEPLRDAGGGDLKYVLDALDQAGLGRLETLVKAAVGVDDKTLAFVTGILQRNQQ